MHEQTKVREAVKAINKPLIFWIFVRAFIINRFRDVVQKV
jgi:hypothetical protein